jgi:hypothetical protein
VVCAVLCGVKPAADVWITQALVPDFRLLAKQWGLSFHIDPHFDRFDERAIRASNAQFGTTRAAIAKTKDGRAEAHIFIAKSSQALGETVAAGWYPLVIDNSIVEKNVADHVRFGRALGYPECCIRFFRRRNHWFYDNTPYAAYRNTRGSANLLSNGLPRNTAFALIAHMPCSFACSETIRQAEKVLSFIRSEAPLYAEHIVRRLSLPMLSLSELRLFAFNGTLVNSNRIEYDAVEPLNPTTQEDLLLKALRNGTACIVDRHIVNIERQGVIVECYLARGDQYGPECPFILKSY